MYRRIVRAKLLTVFKGLNSGSIDAVTNEFAKNAEHYFVGTHSLSGLRSNPEAIRRWYERLLRLLPDIRFDIRAIHIEGPPWRTLAVIEWTETNSGTDGVRTSNEGTNIVRIQWGRVTSVRIYTDTDVLQRTLDRIAAKGTPEAHATPITH
jgi:ketosteroid isomerase-like protein